MSTTVRISHEMEKRYLHTIFFFFGFGIMAWVPRFPEVKENLNLSNGAFGGILTTGSIGAFFGLLTVGHIVHKFGVFRVSMVGVTTLFSCLAAIVHIHTPFYFAIINILTAFSVTTLHISLNTQAFHVQERSGDIVVTSTSGYWSTGALGTAALSGLFVGNVGLALHIDLISALCFISMAYILFTLRPILVPPNSQPESDYTFTDIFKSFHLDWPVSIGLACAVYLEFALGDWGTIFTRERLDIASGLSAVPYLVFTVLMIFGRLRIQKITHKYSIERVAKLGTLLAGTTFIAAITVAVNLPADAKWLSFALFILAFAGAGLGSSILGPSFTSAANRRSPHPSSVVVGQLGVANNVLTTALKWMVAGVVAATGSIALALMIPGILMVIASRFTHVLRES